jgi:protein phosphatase
MSCYETERDPFPAPRPLRIEAAARSDPGRVRDGNEDRVVFGDASNGRSWEAPASVAVEAAPCAFFAAVCDGMGGEAGGEIASDLAVRSIAQAMTRAFGHVLLQTAMVASIETASARIKERARREPYLARMGTTATLAAVCEGALVVGQVGDSRAYVLRDGVLEQITRDQTMAEMLRASGVQPIDDGGEPIGSHVILQALGSSARLEVVVTHTPLEPGDVVLLCSDGLHGLVPDESILAHLSAHADLGAACEALVAAANEAGGNDNISCVAFRLA